MPYSNLVNLQVQRDLLCLEAGRARAGPKLLNRRDQVLFKPSSKAEWLCSACRLARPSSGVPPGSALAPHRLALIAELMVAAILLFVPVLCHAQDSQFVFDQDGNFLIQAAETLTPPQILGQPQMQVVQPGALAAFSVVALDTSGLSYQWLFSGTNLPGQNGDALLINNVTTNNQGYYSVVLANSSGSVTSSPAALWIDSRGCGMPDWWQLQYFGNLTQNATADYDGDGVSNLQEFLDGTNPTNSASALYRLALFSDGGVVQVVPNQSTHNPGDVVTLTATAIAPETFHGWTGDAVAHSNTVTLTMNSNKTVFARFTPIDFYWANSSGGDWSVASNWSPTLVPLTNDNVHLNLGATVTLTNPADCLTLELGANNNNPNLVVSGTLTVHGQSTWDSGQLSGSGRTIIAASGSLTIANQGTLSLNNITLENGGTLLWTGSGNINLNGSTITNRTGALFEAQNAASLLPYSGPYRFDNAGAFRKTVNPGASFVLGFNNYGTVDIETGTLVCNGTFTNTGTVTLAPGTTNLLTGGGFSSGPFVAPAPALVQWTAGTFILNPGAQFNGAGRYQVNGATLVANTDFSVANLDLLNGTLDGSGKVTVGGAMNWTTGTMTGSGQTVIAPGVTLNLVNANNVVLSRVLDNGGTTLWTGAGDLILSGGIITNRTGALFEQHGSGSLATFNPPYEFDNSGIFRKTLDPGTNSVSANFNNFGTVELEAGTLQWNRTLTNSGTVNLSPGTTNRFSVISALSSGPFNAPAATLVELYSGTLTLLAGAQLNGGGLYRINGGALLANTDLSVANLDCVNNGGNSAIDGSGALTINSLMNWTLGTMSGTGRTVISPGATLNLGNASTVQLSRTLENGGTVLWTGAGSVLMNSGIITNRPGALFNAQNAAAFTSYAAPYRFDNCGIFRKSLSSGTTTLSVPFTNYGSVDLQLGVMAANNGYVSTSNALLNCGLGGTTAGSNYGQLQVSGTLTLNGGLSVNLEPGYVPATNDSFTVVTAGSCTNSVTSFSYPSNRVAMVLSNSPTSVILSVTGVLPIPQPVLLTPQILGSNALLTWTATSNVTYRLENKGALSSTNWSAVPGDVTTLSNLASKLDPLTPTNGFYRVRVVP